MSYNWLFIEKVKEMILSFIIILIIGFVFGYISNKIKLPSLIGMIIAGILIGPSILNLIDESMFKIAPYLRQIALIIILTRSGLSLRYKEIYKLGISAILICFIPAFFEIIGILIFGPILLKINHLEALLLGSVLAAVSPAIIVPRMIDLKEKGYGNNKNIPELVMAGASVDDIIVIVIFYTVLGIIKNNKIDFIGIINIPVSIILGVVVGIIIGLVLILIFKKIKNNIINVIILLIVSGVLVFLENKINAPINFSSLISIVTIGIFILARDQNLADNLENKYKKMWRVFEIILFVLVGLELKLSYVKTLNFMPVLLLFIGLSFRTIGVFITLLLSKLNVREKLFVCFAYLPKATVQASIGAVALSENLNVGSLVLSIAILSILLTAPLGAILIDKTHDKLLVVE
jgi:solute carrier family 9B (sodium/hydrogen exchanger), member 1/2